MKCEREAFVRIRSADTAPVTEDEVCDALVAVMDSLAQRHTCSCAGKPTALCQWSQAGSLRIRTGNDLIAVPAVDFKISTERIDLCRTVDRGKPDKASVGQGLRPVSVWASGAGGKLSRV